MFYSNIFNIFNLNSLPIGRILTISLSKLSWRDHKRGRKGIHLKESGSNKRHVILMGVNARAHYQKSECKTPKASPGFSLRVYCISRVFRYKIIDLYLCFTI